MGMLARLALLLGKIPALDWLFVALATFAIGYHVYAVERAKFETKAAVTAEYERKIAQSNADALAAQQKLQAQIDAQAGPSNAELKKQFDKIQSDLRTLGMYKPGKPLPADCKLDEERVRMANKALHP